jgi:5'-3' exonuclease
MKRLAIDASSFMWRALLAGKDPDGIEVEHEGKKVLVATAMYGYENVINSLCRVLRETGMQPINCIFVYEGMNSKARRTMIDKTYKQTRDSRPPEAYIEFGKLREMLEKTWHDLGALACRQPMAEGDDTLAWLAKHTRSPLTIATFDNDLSALNGVNEHGALIEVWNDGLVGVNKYGTFAHHLITVYKALVGDSSDNIKGCEGFGPKAWADFCAAYGEDGLQELYDMLDAGRLDPALHEMAQEMNGKKVAHPLIRKICDQEEQVIRCFKLAKLHPEWVETRTHALEWTAGVVLEAPSPCDERLKQWYQQKVLVTADNFAEVLNACLPHVKKSPFLAFDIESSSADESDEWLAAQGDPDGVDQIGSTLTGFSFTFGANMNRTIYVSVDHANTKNIRMSQARFMIEAFTNQHPDLRVSVDHDLVIHNNHFELPVIYMAQDEDGTYWRDHWAENGFHGFLPRSLDTKLEASYVNENEALGLKHRSMLHLGYKQVEYDDVTTLRGHDLPPGGREIGVQEVDGVEVEVRRYKMRELPATHVFDYGCDDTICTAAQHVFYRLIMELEGTWDIYREVEIDASYLHALNFVRGLAFSLQTCRELEKADDKVYDMAWGKLRAFLIEKEWDGTVPPVFTKDITLPEIKQAFNIVTGDTLDTAVRTVSKLVKMLRDEGADEFAGMLEACAASEEGAMQFTAWVTSHFKPEPTLNMDSPKQIQKLLYETMALPVQIRNKPTPAMKQRGEKGSPKTDELAIRYSMRVASPEIKEILDCIWLVRMVGTRRELYYTKYPYFVHWKTGRIHPSHNQCATNTRRASESKPNKQQLPKHQKVELATITDAEIKASVTPRFREAILPHHEDAVVVSMDFNAQELRNIGEQSQDPNLIACYVGENKKDMHSITGHAILLALKASEYGEMTYEEFAGYVRQRDLDKEFKKTELGQLIGDFRARGKKTNFTTEYGAMAPKLAATMLVTEEEAQMFIDAREAAFPRVAEWKEEIIEEAKNNGFVCTMMGARRHLRAALDSDNFMDASKAERQAVNFKVQGSCGEQTKLAEGRMWRDGIFFEFDAVSYGPIHDEVVSSCAIKDLKPFIKRKHAAMVANYAGMQVPIVSSISFGPNFGVQFEIGEEPTDEAIDKGLEAYFAYLKGEKVAA